MREGTYRDRNGQLVTVRRAETGYVIRYSDGHTIAIAANRRVHS